jgi:hypothetical protein
MNETDKWWAEMMLGQVEQARARASELYANEQQRRAFIDAWHWSMLNARVEIWKFIAEQRKEITR